MIEGGLAVIAACLPTLRCLVRDLSLNSIVNSIRSALGLNSVCARRNQQSATFPLRPYTQIRAKSSLSLDAPMVSRETLEVVRGPRDMAIKLLNSSRNRPVGSEPAYFFF